MMHPFFDGHSLLGTGQSALDTLYGIFKKVLFVPSSVLLVVVFVIIISRGGEEYGFQVDGGPGHARAADPVGLDHHVPFRWRDDG